MLTFPLKYIYARLDNKAYNAILGTSQKNEPKWMAECPK